MSRTGLVHIYTGDGKGKTTASIGLAVRAAGQGLKVLFVQFFKEDKVASGEKEIFRNNIDQIELVRSNVRHPFFTGDKTDKDSVKSSVKETFDMAVKKALEENIDLLVFDEILGAVNGEWLDIELLAGFLATRPETMEVVLTGRNAPVELVRQADYVTEMLSIKHPFDSGHKARKGIEF
ncbi:MAG: cob(I)yrinic acid a,c-diamide adenosyltransferase [Proteobacteria bacterium]|nr:cob(I)yrinic acid a,c-diamide adenosyltransferase [Pseudomonadota bacterium]